MRPSRCSQPFGAIWSVHRGFHQPKTRGGVAERSGATRAKCFLARKFSIVRRARLVSAALACRRARKGPGMVGSVQLYGNFFCPCLGSSQRSPASSSPRSQQFSAGYTQQAAVPAFPEPCLGSSLLRTSSLEPGRGDFTHEYSVAIRLAHGLHCNQPLLGSFAPRV